MYQSKTGNACHCRKGIERDNCPSCEGTGRQIDFRAIRAAIGETYKPMTNEQAKKTMVKVFRQIIKGK